MISQRISCKYNINDVRMDGLLTIVNKLENYVVLQLSR